MSSFAEAEDKKTNPRRRRPAGGGRRRPEEAAPPAERVERAPRPKVERPPAVPFPDNLIGKVSTGVVNSVVRRGKFKFGFINLGTTDEDATDVPRVYFTMEDATGNEFILRRGYPVEFTAKHDEKGRVNAADIKLTDRDVAVERESLVAQKKAERAERYAANPELEKADREAREKRYRDRRQQRGGRGSGARPAREIREPREARPPREPREPREDRLVTIRVTCAGQNESKKLEINLNHSVGRLKAVCLTAFEGAPGTLLLYHVSPENPEGTFLTRSILNKLTESDTIHLGESREKA